MAAAEEICGTTKGGKHLERETLWWNEEVQESMRREKDAFKKWQMHGGHELKEAYKNMKRKTRAAVAKAKNEVYKEWYDKMGTEEGERMIYKVAKQRAMSRKDTGEVNVNVNKIDLIKHLGESGVDMMHEILKRVWEEEQMPEEWKKI